VPGSGRAVLGCRRADAREPQGLSVPARAR
jgi:hypothetical protein